MIKNTGYVLYVLILSLLPLTITGQNSELDSLQYELESRDSDEERAEIYLEMAGEISRNDPELARSYAEEAVKIYETLGDPELTNAYLELASALVIAGEKEKANKYLDISRSRVETIDQRAHLYSLLGQWHSNLDSQEYYFTRYFDLVHREHLESEMASSYYFLGYLSAIKGELSTSDSLWKLGLKNCRKSGDEHEKVSIYYNLCLINFQTSHFDSSLYYARLGLENNPPTSTKIGLLNLMGQISAQQGDSVRAIEYWEESYQILEENNFSAELGMDVLSVLAQVYISAKEYDKAKLKSEKLIELAEKRGQKRHLSKGLIYMAWVAYGNRNEELVLSLLAKALEVKPEKLSLTQESFILIESAVIYCNIGQYEKAGKLLVEAEPLVEKSQAKHNVARVAKYRYLVEKELGHPEIALQELEKFKKLDNELQKAINEKELVDAKVKFDSELKQAEIEKQESEIALLSLKNKTKNQQLLYGLGGALGLFFLIFLWRNRQYERNKLAMQKSFSHQILHSQEKERKRLARELHDGVGQNLSFLKSKLVSSPVEVTLVGNAIEEIRQVSRDLHPFILEQFGLSAALKQLLEKLDENSEILIEDAVMEVDAYVSDDDALHIYRIMQEALNNAVKYSDSGSLTLAARKIDREIEFKVVDRGKGMDVESEKTKLEKLGLKTMHERAEIINAKLEINSELGKGTSVILHYKNSNTNAV